MSTARCLFSKGSRKESLWRTYPGRDALVEGRGSQPQHLGARRARLARRLVPLVLVVVLGAALAPGERLAHLVSEVPGRTDCTRQERK